MTTGVSPSAASPLGAAGSRRLGAPRGLGEHAGAIALLLALAVAGLVVALSDAISPNQVGAIHGDGNGTWEVGKVHVAGWDSPGYNPFGESRLSLPTIPLTFLYLLAVTSIGSIMVRALPGAAAWPRVVRALAGFLPGYVIVFAPLQLVFAAVPLPYASWVALALVLAAGLGLHARALRTTTTALRTEASVRTGLLVTGAGIAAVAGVSILWRLQAGRNFMVNDSVITVLQQAQATLLGPTGTYLGQWDQQSDEWLFSAPLMFRQADGQDYLFPLWLASAMGLASFACIVFGLLKHFAWRRATLTAGVGTALILAATPSILPTTYLSLFGGQNPALWTGHEGRYVGIVAPWLALLLVGRVRDRRTGALAALALAGLAFVSVHAAAYVAAALGAVLVWRLAAGRRELAARVTPGVLGLGVVALAVPLLTYTYVTRVSDPSQLGWLLAGGAVLAGLTALAAAFAGAAAPAVRGGWWRGALFVVGAFALGFLLSGNLKVNEDLRSVLGVLLPGFDRPSISRGLLTEDLTFPSFTGQECTTAITGHCLGGGGFLNAYGVLIALALAGWVGIGRVVAGAPDTLVRWRAAWLLMVAALCASFALVDFTGVGQGVAWILTRFIEVPYYGLLAFGVVALVGARSRVTAAVGTAFVVAWVAIPLIGNGIPLQLGKNVDWLVGAIT